MKTFNDISASHEPATFQPMTPLSFPPKLVQPAIHENSCVQRKNRDAEKESGFHQKMARLQTPSTSHTKNLVDDLNGAQQLPNEVRDYYEPRFGYDFSQVKINTGADAARSADSINALAYTTGNNIVFNTGQYSPHTASGQRLLAHELTHVVQQNMSDSQSVPAIQRSVAINSPYPLERDFDPGAQFKKQDRALGRCDPILNSVSQAPQLNAKRFEQSLQLPGLSERNLDDIDRPDLTDPVLDPVRNNLVELKKKSKSSGKRVKLVQQALVAWGKGLDNPVELLPEFGADGVFGKETEAAVHFFQNEHPPLADDGIVGDLTLAELQSEMDKLHGIIFTLETVGHNVYEGKLHIPPPPKQWKPVNATDDEFFNNKSVGDFSKAQVASQCGSSKKFNISFHEKGNLVPFILTHERVHEKEQLETINNHLVPWDTRLEIALLLKLKFKANNKKEAMEMVFDKSGAERPAKLARTIIQEMQAANKKFHNSPAGQGPNTSLDIVTCSNLKFTYSPAF